MNQAFLIAVVGFGGALGSISRFLLSGLILQQAENWRFPLATFIVNIIGCLVVGVLGGLVVRQDYFSPEIRLFLFTGIAGGFTTFSAFGLETFYLLRKGEFYIAGSYVFASLLIGVLLVGLGFSVISQRV